MDNKPSACRKPAVTASMRPKSSDAVACRSRRRAECPSCRGPQGDVTQTFTGIAARANRLPPSTVRQIPIDGARQSRLEVVLRRPGQGRLSVRWIDLIAEIVTRPIRYELDQPLAWTGWIRLAPVELGADRAHHIEVAARLFRSDPGGGTRFTRLHAPPQ